MAVTAKCSELLRRVKFFCVVGRLDDGVLKETQNFVSKSPF